jgi:hypothetical protein
MIADEKNINARDVKTQKKIFEDVSQKNLSKFYKQLIQDETLLSQSKSLIT